MSKLKDFLLIFKYPTYENVISQNSVPNPHIKVHFIPNKSVINLSFKPSLKIFRSKTRFTLKFPRVTLCNKNGTTTSKVY